MKFLALVAAMTVALCNAQAGGVLDDGENIHLLMNKNFVPVSDEEDVLMKARFQQDCLIEETQDKFACRELFNGCGINVLNQAPDEGEEGGHSASRRARNCHFVLKKECEENHFSSALCRAMFLQDSVGHLRTSSAVTTAMDDPFVKDVMITGIPSSVGCDQTDEEKRYTCLDEKVGQGLALVQNIAGGINSPDDLFNIAEGALELMGRLNPAVAAGLEIARMFFGSSDGAVDVKHKEMLGRFDRLDKKLDEIAGAVGNIGNVVETAFCDAEIESMGSALKNFQRDYDNILKVETTEAIDTWEETCKGGLGGQKILDLIHNSINFLTDDGLGMSCAKDYYETVKNKERKYLSGFVQPLVQKFTQGMQLVLDCPSVHDHDYEELHETLTKVLYKEFKDYLTKARNGWKEGAKAISEDNHKSANAIRLELERDSALEYVYSVVRIHNKFRRDTKLGYFDYSGEKNGLFVAKQPVGQDAGWNVFIFYRKKFTHADGYYNRWCGTAMPEWKNNNSECNLYMCSTFDEGVYWNSCYLSACGEAWRLIRMPEHKGNPSLQASLKKGSILINQRDTIYDISSSPHYQLERGPEFREGNSNYYAFYHLFYPKHKLYMSNVALNKPASQSSTHWPGSTFPASKAVNGCTNGKHKGFNCFTHTKTQSDPWWKVDLGKITWVNSIRIFNREVLQSRLKNVIVEVIDTTETGFEKVVYRKQYDEGDGIINRAYIFGSINAYGDVVRVSLKGENRILSLAEVEVYNDY